MFNNLIESKPQKTRTLGSTLFSIGFHAVIIGMSVLAGRTAR